MKRVIFLLLSVMLTSVLIAQTPQLTFKIENPRIVYSYNDKFGGYCQNLEWDVYLKCDQSGTRYKAIGINFSIDEVNLTDFDYTPGNIGPAPAQLSRYNITVTNNSGNFNFALTSNQPYNSTITNRFTEIPTTFDLFGTFRARIVDYTIQDNIHFLVNLMNGQQYEKLFASPWSRKYLDPNLYEGNMDNIYLGRIYNASTGWWQYGGTTPDAQYIDWNTAVNTTVWEGTATITQSDNTAAMFQNLNIINGATLNIAANKWATVQGNLTNTGSASNLVVQSGGSLITQGTVTGQGTLYSATANNAWKLISPPVPGLTANLFLNQYLQSYDEATNTWSDIVNATTPLVVGKGYAAWAPATTYTGTFNTGDFNIPVTKNGPGFNLVGNPYPSGLDINNPSAWGGGLGAGKWVWNQAFGNYQTTVNTVPPAQGFFVLASATNTFTLPNTARTHTSTPLIKSGEANELKLLVEGNNYADEAFVKLAAGSTVNFDYAYDVPKMFGLVDAPQMYTVVPQGEFTQLTTNVFPDIATNDVVPLHLRVGAETSYTLTASGIESFVEQTKVTLVDLKTGTSQVLNNSPVYSFTASPNDDPGRFLLLFAHATGVENPELAGVKIFTNDRTLMVNMPISGEAIIYDLVGKELYRTTVQPGLNQIPFRRASAWYLVKVVTPQGTVTEKVFIR